MSSAEYEFFCDVFKYQEQTDLLNRLQRAHCPDTGGIDWHEVWGEQASLSSSLARISRMVYENHDKRRDASQMRFYLKYVHRVIADRDRKSFKSFNWKLFEIAAKLMYEVPGDGGHLLKEDGTPCDEALEFLKEQKVGWCDISEFFVAPAPSPKHEAGGNGHGHHHKKKHSIK